MTAARRNVDRRIQKTERHLHAALSALIREKPYTCIAVKEILDRANVGRSTFYTHFRDKDELLVSSIREMIRSGRPATGSAAAPRSDDALCSVFPSSRTWTNTAGRDRMGAKGRAFLHGRLEQVVTELLIDEMERDGHHRKAVLPPDLLARHVAATFVLVLNWWVETGSTLTPGEINNRFLALVSPVFAKT